MRTPAGWLLIDWDTAWWRRPNGTCGASTPATDRFWTPTPRRPGSSFRRRHTGNRDDEESWNILSRLLAALPSRPG
ncbi:MAG TPA: hypothetical protein VFM37_05025 [Pseudonocardiaceae bacterium]|nr:hypothetical protein [Pseudonocardiaceae bacterium]